MTLIVPFGVQYPRKTLQELIKSAGKIPCRNKKRVSLQVNTIMAEVVRLPKMSDTMTEGVIVKWNYKVGDSVKSGDILACLLYTSPSPRDGLLSRMPSSA